MSSSSSSSSSSSFHHQRDEEKRYDDGNVSETSSPAKQRACLASPVKRRSANTAIMQPFNEWQEYDGYIFDQVISICIHIVIFFLYFYQYFSSYFEVMSL